MIFDKSNELIANTEHQLLSRKKPYKFLSRPVREVLLPFNLMIKGIEITFRDIIKFYFIFLAGGGIVLFLSKQFSIDNSNIIPSLMVQIIFFIALFSTIFSVPSTISKYGVNNIHIDYIIKEIERLKIQCNEIKYIEKNIKNFQDKFKTRINFFRSLLVLLWGWNTFLMTKKLNIIFDSDHEINKINTIPNIFTEINTYWLLIGLFLMVEFYNKGSLFIFKSVEFSLNEFEAQGSISKQTPTI